MPALVSLNISKNALGAMGASAVGGVLKGGGTLQNLNLSACQLGGKGTKLIAEGLGSVSVDRSKRHP